MIAGGLRHIIEITSSLPGTTPGGHYIPAGQTVFKAFASIRGIRGSETIADGAEQQRETIEVIMRFRRDLDTSMRVVWGGKSYDIERIDPTPYERQFMRLWASCKRKVGGGQGG